MINTSEIRKYIDGIELYEREKPKWEDQLDKRSQFERIFDQKIEELKYFNFNCVPNLPEQKFVRYEYYDFECGSTRTFNYDPEKTLTLRNITGLVKLNIVKYLHDYGVYVLPNGKEYDQITMNVLIDSGQIKHKDIFEEETNAEEKERDIILDYNIVFSPGFTTIRFDCYNHERKENYGFELITEGLVHYILKDKNPHYAGEKFPCLKGPPGKRIIHYLIIEEGVLPQGFKQDKTTKTRKDEVLYVKYLPREKSMIFKFKKENGDNFYQTVPVKECENYIKRDKSPWNNNLPFPKLMEKDIKLLKNYGIVERGFKQDE